MVDFSKSLEYPHIVPQWKKDLLFQLADLRIKFLDLPEQMPMFLA